ncbi:uncharacterized protein TNCV_4126311 [Trichonephila clavipes]|nr:uncharacterized protein TNCV_4126311 [Trichonephila clavipes]
MDILKLNKAKTSLKGSITRIANFMDNVSEHVDITELEVKGVHKRMQCTSTYMCPCGKKHSRSLCTAAMGDRRKWVIPPAELPAKSSCNISSDIRQAFLQICLADKHKDFVRFLWTDSNPRIGEKLTLQVYRFNRVIFGVNSSPFLLAATIKYHIEKYNEIHPITVQHLDSFMYVDDWITGQDTREEALFMSRHAKNIMKEAGMEMRKWISNDTVLMAQWAAEGFDTHPMDTSIRLGTNKTKVLGMAWQTLDDCLTLDTKGKIFDPLGLLSPFTIRIKCLIQELWIKKITWDEILPPKLKEKWFIWCKELPLLDNLRIPRLVLDSTNDEVSDLIKIHIFCDASKLAYGAAAYVKVRKQNEVLVNLITSKTKVAPLKAVTLPRLELLGALAAARLSSRVQEIVHKKRECKVFHWTDSKIVLFWIKGSSKRWKQFVANRVQEISKLTDFDSCGFIAQDKTIPQISCLGDLVLIHLFPTTSGELVQPS